jgi:hypothetical protein
MKQKRYRSELKSRLRQLGRIYEPNQLLRELDNLIDLGLADDDLDDDQLANDEEDGLLSDELM